MKTLKLRIKGLELLADGGAAILTVEGKDNPSKNGVHQINTAQLRRICFRSLGFFSPIALKQYVEMSNGSATLNIDAEECKTGQPFENKKTGEKGVYSKDWTKYSNHEIKLGYVATEKLAEMATKVSLEDAIRGTSQPRVRQEEEKPEEKENPKV